MLARLAVLALFVCSAPSLADNLVLNPHFHEDVAHWNTDPANWTSEDQSGDALSGSFGAELPGHAGATLRSNCFSLAGGERVVYGASGAFVGTEPDAARIGASLRFFAQPNCAGAHESTPYPLLIAESAWAGWGPTQATAVAPPGTQSAELAIWLNAVGDEPATFRVDNAFVELQASCKSNESVLCLQQGRFRVTARYRIPEGGRGYAGVRPLSGDSAYLWFFSASNLELVIKVLDGCGFNERFWIYAAGLTNLGVDLRVVDTLTGEAWSFDNPVDVAFPPQQDIEAFSTCGPGVAVTAGGVAN